MYCILTSIEHAENNCGQGCQKFVAADIATGAGFLSRLIFLKYYIMALVIFRQSLTSIG